jgi:hypothetical protein
VINLINSPNYSSSFFPSIEYYTNLEKEDSELYLIRKRILGNSRLVIVYQNSSAQEFNVSLISSSVVLIYMVVTSVNDFFLVTIHENPMAKYKLLNNILKFFEKEFLVIKQYQSTYLRDIVLQISNLITYYTQKEEMSYFAKENTTGHVNHQSEENDIYMNNLILRYRQIDRILFKFKTS